MIKVCTLDYCDRPHESHGYCRVHAAAYRAGKELKPLRKRAKTAQWHTSKRDGYVRKIDRIDGKVVNITQHRYVMEQHLGRPLIKGENVHHINGVRHDNRLENLELWSTVQPAGQRVEDKVKWAREILALYGDLI